ncbi:hypothetical protein D3C73_1024690 [compost metagenome]
MLQLISAIPCVFHRVVCRLQKQSLIGLHRHGFLLADPKKRMVKAGDLLQVACLMIGLCKHLLQFRDKRGEVLQSFLRKRSDAVDLPQQIPPKLPGGIGSGNTAGDPDDGNILPLHL